MGYWSELRAFLFKDPAKVIRYLVLFVCCVIVIVQLYECFYKLRNPPLSTHSYYNLNDSIEMPAVTICREPPYKEPVLTEISKNPCVHPKYSSCWLDYPYDEVHLDEFFANSTFYQNETFLQYGLNGFAKNVEITNSTHFYLGLCHTLKPKIRLKRTDRNTGYSMILTHHVNYTNYDYDKTKYLETLPGWHIFVHDARENFTEIHMKASGRVEYVFAEINEEIEIKLENQFFSNVETKRQACSMEKDYSDLKCGEVCIWNDIAAKVNCSGPWMQEVLQAYCSNYKSMKSLITEYSNVYDNDADGIWCDCAEPCETRIFSTYIQNRKNFNQPDPRTQVWIYYTMKLVSMMEERPSYDNTQFIADIGGSLGFLLGLSVLGLIGLLENMTLFFCGGCIRKMQNKDEQRKRLEEDQESQRTDTTIDIATIYKTEE